MSYTNCYDSMMEPVSKSMRSFETVCTEPPHSLSGASEQVVRTIQTKHWEYYAWPKNSLLETLKQASLPYEAGSVRPESRLYETLKQAPLHPKAGSIRVSSRLRRGLKQAPSGSQAGSVGVSSRLRQGLKQAPSGSQTGSFFVFSSFFPRFSVSSVICHPICHHLTSCMSAR